MNGYQRLWVVCSAVVALVLANSCVESFPTAAETRVNFEGAKQFRISWVIKNENSILEKLTPGKFYDEQLAISQKVVDDERIRLDKLANSALDDLPARQAKEIFKWIGIWFGITIGGYAIGWAINWVRIGFRPKEDNPS